MAKNASNGQSALEAGRKAARRRAAASPKAEEPTAVQGSIYLTPAEWKAVKTRAIEDGVRYSAVVRAAVRSYLEMDDGD